MTSLLADLERAVEEARIAKQGDLRCRFGIALDAFPDDADAILAKAAPGPGREMRRSILRSVLEKHGHSGCGESTIDRHWRKTCACYR